MLSGWALPGDLSDEKRVLVWRVELETSRPVLGRCAALLNAEEQERAGRYRSQEARELFVLGRATLRVLLGRALGMPPGAVVLGRGPQGKPRLPEGGLEFNVAHSHGVLLLALSRGGQVGIDVEWMGGDKDDAELMEIAQTSFTAREAFTIRSLPGRAERLRAFYRCWTRKEAVLKADGRGLTIPLNAFEVPVHQLGEKAILLGAEEGRGMSRPLFLYPLVMHEPYVASLAVGFADAIIWMFELPGPSIEEFT